MTPRVSARLAVASARVRRALQTSLPRSGEGRTPAAATPVSVQSCPRRRTIWAAPGPGPEELAEQAELAGMVRGAVTGLARRDATAIGLVAMGFGVADVAAALGIAHGAAAVALHRARRRLKGARGD